MISDRKTITSDRQTVENLTIWDALAMKLKREPTNAEACAKVRRILEEAATERKGGKQ